jgi:hypothetical protein
MSAPSSLRSQQVQVVLKIRAGPGVINGVWRLRSTEWADGRLALMGVDAPGDRLIIAR